MDFTRSHVVAMAVAALIASLTSTQSAPAQSVLSVPVQWCVVGLDPNGNGVLDTNEQPLGAPMFIEGDKYFDFFDPEHASVSNPSGVAQQMLRLTSRHTYLPDASIFFHTALPANAATGIPVIQDVSCDSTGFCASICEHNQCGAEFCDAGVYGDTVIEDVGPNGEMTRLLAKCKARWKEIYDQAASQTGMRIASDTGITVVSVNKIKVLGGGTLGVADLGERTLMIQDPAYLWPNHPRREQGSAADVVGLILGHEIGHSLPVPASMEPGVTARGLQHTGSSEGDFGSPCLCAPKQPQDGPPAGTICGFNNLMHANPLPGEDVECPVESCLDTFRLSSAISHQYELQPGECGSGTQCEVVDQVALARQGARNTPGCRELELPPSGSDPVLHVPNPPSCRPSISDEHVDTIPPPQPVLDVIDLIKVRFGESGSPDSRVEFTFTVMDEITCATLSGLQGINFYVVADLDNNAQTGGAPSSLGADTQFVGAELVARASVQAGRIDGCFVFSSPTVWRFQGGQFQEVADSSIKSRIIKRSASSGHKLTENVRISFSEAVRGPAASNYRAQALTQATFQDGSVESDRIGSDTGRTVSRVLPSFPACTVTSGAAVPGTVAAVEVTGLGPSSSTEVFLGAEKLPVSFVTDQQGGGVIHITVPAGTTPGLHPVTLNSVGTALSAACPLRVLEPPPCGLDPVETTVSVCTPGPQPIQVGTPEASCAGEVISRNGQPLAPTVMAVDGSATLMAGSYVVRWTWVDASGNPQTWDQSVTVEQVANTSCCDSGQTLIEGDELGNSIVPQIEQPYCIFGYGGQDNIQTLSGADMLFGGAESAETGDFINGGSGADVLLGGPGGDHLYGASGSHLKVWGEDGADILHALTAQSAELYGGLGADSITGSPGADLLVPSADADFVSAGDGDDTVILRHECEAVAGESLDGGAGDDTLVTPVSVSELQARGATINSFETIIVDTSHGHLSECF